MRNMAIRIIWKHGLIIPESQMNEGCIIRRWVCCRRIVPARLPCMNGWGRASPQISQCQGYGLRHGWHVGLLCRTRCLIIDECAWLTAACPSPAKEQKFWHVGHFLRHVPEGYQESLEHDAECITDLNLRKFYRKLCLITRGSLIDPKRLFTIFKMNIGRYDSLIDRDRYIYENGIRSAFRNQSARSRELNGPLLPPNNLPRMDSKWIWAM